MSRKDNKTNSSSSTRTESSTLSSSPPPATTRTRQGNLFFRRFIGAASTVAGFFLTRSFYSVNLISNQLSDYVVMNFIQNEDFRYLAFVFIDDEERRTKKPWEKLPIAFGVLLQERSLFFGVASAVSSVVSLIPFLRNLFRDNLGPELLWRKFLLENVLSSCSYSQDSSSSSSSLLCYTNAVVSGLVAGSAAFHFVVFPRVIFQALCLPVARALVSGNWTPNYVPISTRGDYAAATAVSLFMLMAAVPFTPRLETGKKILSEIQFALGF